MELRPGLDVREEDGGEHQFHHGQDQDSFGGTQHQGFASRGEAPCDIEEEPGVEEDLGEKGTERMRSGYVGEEGEDEVHDGDTDDEAEYDRPGVRQNQQHFFPIIPDIVSSFFSFFFPFFFSFFFFSFFSFSFSFSFSFPFSLGNEPIFGCGD
eukprot:CAMPEP_0175058304 /NCGR_PEP_ID=MMETSP0052_2-20121109/11773_1 /TAXON_ID=51329 ORGANISM="Polytomella parva, Strain SAG 63-3" /NCGR_SAMPLE_ID=MMETSP0052_2 /ASSEMBLY_ACC=CAM_ASM_000194 /LENGTH=152 /DNA_ID=CAMNT_0016323669 /DNA_START=195 /DNA_END=656 /DNA_ORIENTATION=-